LSTDGGEERRRREGKKRRRRGRGKEKEKEKSKIVNGEEKIEEKRLEGRWMINMGEVGNEIDSRWLDPNTYGVGSGRRGRHHIGRVRVEH